MASIVDRLAHLEGRKRPPAPPPSPGNDLLLKLVDHERRRLDYEDRLHSPRLEPGEGAEPEPPEPLELSLAEKREMLANVPEWIAYLEGERERAPAGLGEIIAEAIETSRQSAVRLETEIATMEEVDE